MVSDDTANSSHESRSVDLLEMAGISEKSPFLGMYFEELYRLSILSRSIADDDTKQQFWNNVNKETNSYLNNNTGIIRLMPKGRYSNPVFGQYKGHELLGALLQRVSFERKDIYDGLEILLVEAFYFNNITGSYRASTASEIRMGVESFLSKRSGIFKQLPTLHQSSYLEQLRIVVNRQSNQDNLNDVQKGFIRALGRLLGLKLLNDPYEPKGFVSRKVMLAPKKPEAVRPRILKKRSVDPDGKAKGRALDIYEIVEPQSDEDVKMGEPPEEYRIFQDVLDQTELGFDVETNQQRRLSAYWLEQTAWVSPFNSGLMIEPDRSHLCECIRKGLAADDERLFFTAGITALSLCTGSKPKLLMELDEDHFEQNGYFIRKINVPESAFKPAAEYQDFWLSPINNISFHLPPHLHPWLRRFINVSGNIEPPIALRSEKILTEAFQDFLKYARAKGRYEITESKIQNALRRELARSHLGLIAAFLITGRLGERPPVINHYAAISPEQLQDVYSAAMEKLWL